MPHFILTMTIEEFFGEPIYSYTRKQALEDGMQVDANIGDLAEVTRRHYKRPVFMTIGVFSIVQAAVENLQLCNDWQGVWHDVLWMSRHPTKPLSASKILFKVAIAGKVHQMIAEVGLMDIDDPAPVVTIMLPDEE